ncbi:uncharacterized protein [Anabrus simplex]|uniref:uncharacterized protein isoform X2 n=1 Tax=Anabrus simplex TaxID=316456 RepID=UPI0035A365AF
MENVVTVKCEPDWPQSTEPELESIEEPHCVLEEGCNAVTEVWVKPGPDSEDLISEDPVGLESNNEEQNCSAGNMEASGLEANDNSEASEDEAESKDDKLSPDRFNEVRIQYMLWVKEGV